MKICYTCKKEKEESSFSISQLKNSDYRCKECVKKKNKEWYLKNKEKVKEKSKAYYCTNLIIEKEKRKIRREKDKEKIKLENKLYRSTHKKEYNRYRNEYDKQRKIRDPNYKLKKLLRHRLYLALKKSKKITSHIKELGCSIEELKLYLEKQFQIGMTWENWNNTGWHIDHIKPLSKFNLTDINQIKEACHYTNLQPLWAKDNILKGNKESNYGI